MDERARNAVIVLSKVLDLEFLIEIPLPIERATTATGTTGIKYLNPVARPFRYVVTKQIKSTPIKLIQRLQLQYLNMRNGVARMIAK
jgi:hypothetical protein